MSATCGNSYQKCNDYIRQTLWHKSWLANISLFQPLKDITYTFSGPTEFYTPISKNLLLNVLECTPTSHFSTCFLLIQLRSTSMWDLYSHYCGGHLFKKLQSCNSHSVAFRKGTGMQCRISGFLGP